MMIEFSKEWCLAVAELERNVTPGAGVVAMRPEIKDHGLGFEGAVDEGRIVLGRFVNLMRRQRKLSIEKLAEDADLDIGEVMSIEENASHLPDPRTVHRLASFFNVNPGRLMELAGLVRPKDTKVFEHAVRYAARSESIEALSSQEQAALDGLITVLSEKATAG